MGVSIGHAKQKFAAIIEGLHKEPPVLSQFAVWLDLKLSEYKLQGGMRLDSHEIVSSPDWMQGIKCRCLASVSSRMQTLVQTSGFGETAWMFPLLGDDSNKTDPGNPEDLARVNPYTGDTAQTVISSNVLLHETNESSHPGRPQSFTVPEGGSGQTPGSYHSGPYVRSGSACSRDSTGRESVGSASGSQRRFSSERSPAPVGCAATADNRNIFSSATSGFSTATDLSVPNACTRNTPAAACFPTVKELTSSRSTRTSTARDLSTHSRNLVVSSISPPPCDSSLRALESLEHFTSSSVLLPRKPVPLPSASTFLSNLALAASTEHQNDAMKSAPKNLKQEAATMQFSPSASEADEDGAVPGELLTMDMPPYQEEEESEDDKNGCQTDEEVDDYNDVEEDETYGESRMDDDDDDEEEEDGTMMPQIISVTSVDPNSSICLPAGFRPPQVKATKRKPAAIAIGKYPRQKLRIVRNYSKEYKLKVAGYSLRYGTRETSKHFEIAKSNVQRWTTRLVKSSPYCGLPNDPDLVENIAKAEEHLASWLLDNYKMAGDTTINQIQEIASSIFSAVHPEFEPTYAWALKFLAKYKMAQYVDFPDDLSDNFQDDATTEPY